ATGSCLLVQTCGDAYRTVRAVCERGRENVAVFRLECKPGLRVADHPPAGSSQEELPEVPHGSGDADRAQAQLPGEILAREPPAASFDPLAEASAGDPNLHGIGPERGEGLVAAPSLPGTTGDPSEMQQDRRREGRVPTPGGRPVDDLHQLLKGVSDVWREVG